MRLFRNVFLLDGLLDDDPTIEENEAEPHAVAITGARSVVNQSSNERDGWACTISFLRLQGNMLRTDPEEYVKSLHCMRQYEKTVLSAYLCILPSDENNEGKIIRGRGMSFGEISPGTYRYRLTSTTAPRELVEPVIREILWLAGGRLDHCMDDVIREVLSHLGFDTDEDGL